MEKVRLNFLYWFCESNMGIINFEYDEWYETIINQNNDNDN